MKGHALLFVNGKYQKIVHTSLHDLDDYATAPARVLSDDDMIMLKTLRFYRDQKRMQDPVPGGKWYLSSIESLRGALSSPPLFLEWGNEALMNLKDEESILLPGKGENKLLKYL